MIIACDVDGVLAKLHNEILRRYNFDYNDCLTVDDIHSWDMALYVKPECGEKIYDYFSCPDLYKDNHVKIFPLSLVGVVKLKNAGHRIVYVTTPAPGTNGSKMKWLQHRGFLGDENDYVECKDKSLIRADVLIDDGAHNLRTFHGKRIQFLQPWNKDEFVPGAWIACSWGEIPDIIEEISRE